MLSQMHAFYRDVFENLATVGAKQVKRELFKDKADKGKYNISASCICELSVLPWTLPQTWFV